MHKLQKRCAHKSIAIFAATVLIRLYQLIISPVLGLACRFYPSCSHYAMEAIQRYGLRKGIWLAIKRLSKCHPWNAGGFDPVP